MKTFRPPVIPLFVPGDRPDRFKKAIQSGADAIIIDLEDAVAVSSKDEARDNLIACDLSSQVSVIVRINAADTPWFEADLNAISSLDVHAVMLPKTETEDDLNSIAQTLGKSMPLIGLIETAKGISSLYQLCKATNLKQLAFGSIDYALDLNCDETRETLLYARSHIVNCSCSYDLHPPLDSVTQDFKDHEIIKSDSEYAASLGFGGKLLIHPSQIDPARSAFLPSTAEVAWANRIIEVSKSGAGVIELDGKMIDKPVISKALRILELAAQLNAR